jgi:hypothetical protein
MFSALKVLARRDEAIEQLQLKFFHENQKLRNLLGFLERRLYEIEKELKNLKEEKNGTENSKE